MSQRVYITTCIAIVTIGTLLTGAQVLVDGASWGDFIALVIGVPLGLTGVTLARRNARSE